MGSGVEGWEIVSRGGNGNGKLSCGWFIMQIKPWRVSAFGGPFIKKAVNGLLRFLFPQFHGRFTFEITAQYIATLILLCICLFYVVTKALKLQVRVVAGYSRATPLFWAGWGTPSQWSELTRIIHRWSREAPHTPWRLCEEGMLIHLPFQFINIPVPFSRTRKTKAERQRGKSLTNSARDKYKD